MNVSYKSRDGGSHAVTLDRVIFAHHGGAEQMKLVFRSVAFGATLARIKRASSDRADYAAFRDECRASYELFKKTSTAVVLQQQRQQRWLRRTECGAIDILFL